ncbi:MULTISPECIES: GNAT family N-acetyltransferase [unclassified Streptomyces]|uniref:GNAT family N-acetyltransferase n=1 Tax=unclassified Streptomyces TaxID=2593676 RepID=UPI001F542B68|nr:MULTISPECIES: GNAT family N-acetyltransferase [unclassified Streptomyces]
MTPADVITIRPPTPPDWDAIAALESDAYGPLGLAEGREALRSKAVSPETCFVLRSGPKVAGYLLSLPYPPRRAPALGSTAPARFHSRNLHLHDMVVAPEYRGRGLGRRLVTHLERTAAARGYEEVSLIAVAGAGSYWSACGYAPDPHVPTAGYGRSAVYMSRSLPPAPPSPGSPSDTPRSH